MDILTFVQLLDFVNVALAKMLRTVFGSRPVHGTVRVGFGRRLGLLQHNQRMTGSLTKGNGMKTERQGSRKEDENAFHHGDDDLGVLLGMAYCDRIAQKSKRKASLCSSQLGWKAVV